MTKYPKHLLIDADSLLYKFASIHEKTFDFGVVSHTDTFLDEAKDDLDEFIARIIEETQTQTVQLYLTGKTNFRYDVLPTYKHNRKDTPKPLLLQDLREYMVENYNVQEANKIEADDACVIMMYRHPERYILAHIDKDLDQGVGWHYNWNKEDLYYITQEEADSFFLQQILQGDSTDGYSGCPSVGKVGALQILANPVLKVSYEHVLKSGKRKGEVETRWKEVPTDDIWASIVSHYEWKGLTEADAIVQAQVARMLRDDEWDRENQEVILWQPTKLKQKNL